MIWFSWNSKYCFPAPPSHFTGRAEPPPDQPGKKGREQFLLGLPSSHRRPPFLEQHPDLHVGKSFIARHPRGAVSQSVPLSSSRTGTRPTCFSSPGLPTRKRNDKEREKIWRHFINFLSSCHPWSSKYSWFPQISESRAFSSLLIP